MTLKSFTDGGYDVEEPKLLVCVKSIGARKKCEWFLSPILPDRVFISGLLNNQT